MKTMTALIAIYQLETILVVYLLVCVRGNNTVSKYSDIILQLI